MRNRMLNPELFKDEALAALPLGATLLFEGLWCIADDCGCLEDRSRVIRSEVFGVRDDVTVADVDAWLTALVECGKLLRYEVEGHSYLWIAKFHKHQRFQYRPKIGVPLPADLPAELRSLYGGGTDDGASLDVSAEHSGTLRNIPEESGTLRNSAEESRIIPQLSGVARPRGSEAKRSEASLSEERSSKAKRSEGAPAEPVAAAPPLAACVETFAAVAERPVAPDEERRIADWLAGKLPKARPPRDLDAFAWGIARGANEAESNIIAFAATVAIDAPARAPPQGWNRWNVRDGRNGAAHERQPGTVPRAHPGAAGAREQVRPAEPVGGRGDDGGGVGSRWLAARGGS